MTHSSNGETGRRDFMKLLSTVTATAGGTLAGFAIAEAAEKHKDSRAVHGLDVLKQVGGEGYDKPFKAIRELSPDFANLIIEHGYGEVVGRPGVDLVTREAMTITCLMALGNHTLPIKYHLNGFLNVGGKPEQLLELCFVAIAILGFPAAIKTTDLIRDVFKERGIKIEPAVSTSDNGVERYVMGARHMIANTENGLDTLKALTETSPDFAKFLVQFAYGEILIRDGLDVRTKKLSMLTMLATVGNSEDWVRDVTLSALRQNVKKEEIVEAIIQLTVYAGYPAAVVGFFQVKEVFDALDKGEIKLAAKSGDVPDIKALSRDERYKKGLETLSQTSGAVGDKIVQSFSDLAPDLARHLIEHSYGDIFSRKTLDPKVRELTAISAMASHGTLTSETPFKVHVHAGLTVGLSKTDITEALLNLVPYIGFPRIKLAMTLAQSVFDERGV